MRFLTVMTLVLALMLIGCEDRSEILPRHARACIPQCAVSFARLVPEASEYDGRKIYIAGYLALSNGNLTLQPSKEAYLSSIGDSDAIVLRVPVAAQRTIIDAHLNRYVSVRGQFFAGSDDPVIGMGRFAGEVDVYDLITREDAESIEKWKVRLEDF